MNLLETIVFSAIVLSTYLCGRCLSQYLGVVGWILALLLPCLVATVVYKRQRMRLRSQPPLPPCKNGVCSWGDYEGVESRFAYSDDGKVTGVIGTVLRCRCGAKYLDSTDQAGLRRFVELLEDGSTKPYMVLLRDGRWVSETSVDFQLPGPL